jgi:hypothetical protein
MEREENVEVGKMQEIFAEIQKTQSHSGICHENM